jgi:hypothetical protein
MHDFVTHQHFQAKHDLGALVQYLLQKGRLHRVCCVKWSKVVALLPLTVLSLSPNGQGPCESCRT